MVELRVDLIKDLKISDLQLIQDRINQSAGKVKKEAILTCRKKEFILKAFNLGFDYFDIDLSLIKDFNFLNFKDKIIVSFHNFKKTPMIVTLRKIIKQMRKFNVRVIKIATMINDDQDIKNLFKILLDKKKDEQMIIVGMGEKGKITRVVGPLLGSFLTFASTQYGESAPGQIRIEKLKKIYQAL